MEHCKAGDDGLGSSARAARGGRCLALRKALAALALLGAGTAAIAGADNPFDDLYAQPSRPGPSALGARFFGTTTILFQLGEDSVLVDGFFTRPGGLLRLAFGRIEPDGELIAATMRGGQVPPNLGAVLVSHTHFDHALDSAWVACDATARLVGPQSAHALLKAQRETGRACGASFQLIEPVMQFGAIEVEAANSEHVPGLLMEGKIDAIRMPAHFTEFRLDSALSFLVYGGGSRVLVATGMPVNRSRFKGKRADVVFLSIGGLRSSQKARVEEYWNATVRMTKAKLVVPMHWDDFTRPLEAKLPVMPALFGDFRFAMCELLALARRDKVQVRLLRTFEQLDMGKLSRTASAATEHPACPAELRE